MRLRSVAEHDAFEASAEAKKQKLPWTLVVPCGAYAIVGGYR